MIRIEYIEIRNFRSIIKKALSFDSSEYNVIVGPNNSGKSNILRALELFLNGTVDRNQYNYDIDFPKSMKLSSKDTTQVIIEFLYDPQKEKKIDSALSEMEKNSKQTRLLNNRIRLRLKVKRNGEEEWGFIGKAGSLQIRMEYITRIVDSIKTSIRFKYIPVGRDILSTLQSEISQEMVKTIFSGWSGTSVKFRQNINESLNRLLTDLRPPLTKSSKSISKSLSSVFTEIKELELRLPFSDIESMLPLLIPDLTDHYSTSLDTKGAGIQTSSLLFFLKYLADNHPQRNNAITTFIWAIEEPESFLHPKRQRGISEILKGFANEVQTFITTHSAHFVPQDKNTTLLVVEKEKEEPFSTFIIGTEYVDARNSLGVTLLDSMFLNKINIIVEGPSDEILISGALNKLSEAGLVKLNPEEVKFFPANNCKVACTAYENMRLYDDNDDIKKLLIIDGDKAGNDALTGLAKRMKLNENITIRGNKDYIQVSSYTEALCSDRVKQKIIEERPTQIIHTKDIDGVFTRFELNQGSKKKAATRIIEISQIDDLTNFKKLIEIIEKAI